MGYESRLYIVNKTDIIDNEMFYAEKIAEFNLCTVYDVSSKIKQYPVTNAYIYSDDGNTRILEDMYGERLTEIPINDVILIIEEAMKNDEYRRYKPCLQLLKGFNQLQWKNLVVLHYGY